MVKCCCCNNRQLVLVQVHGSCEDERMFYVMSYLKNKYRHKLDDTQGK